MTPQEHMNSNKTEATPSTPEKKDLSLKKVQKYVAGAVLALVVLSGIFYEVSNSSNNDTKPNRPVATAPANQGEKKLSIPSEAKSFVSEFGGRYADPVSTYYAEKAYESEHNGANLLMSDEYIKEYDPSGEKKFPTSPLGFTLGQLPIDAEPDIQTSMNVFNDYTAPMLSRYMNCLARNPSPEAIKVIDDQFLVYCAGKKQLGSGPWQKSQLDYAQRLMNTAKGVVSEYGSAANYNIAPASTDYANKGVTYFEAHNPTMVGTVKANNQESKIIHNNGMRLVIKVKEYDNKEVTETNEIIDNVEMAFGTQPWPMIKKGDMGVPANYISIGQIQ